MPHYQVEYSRQITDYQSVTIEAANFEAAEDAAIEKLNVNGKLNEDYFIESIEEIKNVA